MVSELPEKLEMLINVAGEVRGMFLLIALNGNSGYRGKESNCGAGTWVPAEWCWQLGNPENLAVRGPSHSVPLKLMPQAVLQLTSCSTLLWHTVEWWDPGGECVSIRSPHCLAHIPLVPSLKINGCGQVVKGGLQPCETTLGKNKYGVK